MFPRPLRIGLLLAVLAGVAWRFDAVFLHTHEALLGGCDGTAYWDLAQSVAAGKGFTHTNPALLEQCGSLAFTGLGPSHHFSPLLPLLEAGAIQVLGPSTFALQASVFLLGVLALGVAYWTTRDLLGHSAGLLVAAWAAADWSLQKAAQSGYAEPLVFLTFCLTLWAILRSLEDERYILWAGLFAGLGYLSKASMGWFFLAAGLGGLAWRLLHRGRAVLTNRWYLGAIAVFGGLFAFWAFRNLRLYGDGSAASLLTAWQTSAYNSHAFSEAVARPARLLEGAALRLPMILWGVMPTLVAFWGPLRTQAARWRDEAVSGLLLAAGLMVFLGFLFAAVFHVVEDGADGFSPLWRDPLRYVAAAQLPLLWLALAAPGVRPWRAWALGAATLLQGYTWLLE
ncbi:MAG: hypothetical protein QOD77_1213 [Thermoplasmata archaeon]|nr:hypothetical protein [Thermoplasmata archaeon]